MNNETWKGLPASSPFSYLMSTKESNVLSLVVKQYRWSTLKFPHAIRNEIISHKKSLSPMVIVISFSGLIGRLVLANSLSENSIYSGPHDKILSVGQLQEYFETQHMVYPNS